MAPTPPKFPPPGSWQARVVNAMAGLNVRLYRLSGGRLGNRMGKAPVLLLDHVGRKSGQKRTAPLLYLADGDDLILVASRGGSDATPAWWLNLRDSPATSVQIGRERRAVVAREAAPEERERLWPRLVEMYPDYAVYQQRTDRQIAVIVLEPSG